MFVRYVRNPLIGDIKHNVFIYYILYYTIYMYMYEYM